MAFEPRKRNRIPHYDHSLPNYYFLTICAHDRKCIFGGPAHPNKIGRVVERCILKIGGKYPQARVDKYVVMPNHVHMILVLEGEDPPTVPHIVSQFKGAVSKEVRTIFPDLQVWQRSYYDHVIRDQNSYDQIWLYIDGNPQNWEKDDHFVENSPY